MKVVWHSRFLLSYIIVPCELLFKNIDIFVWCEFCCTKKAPTDLKNEGDSKHAGVLDEDGKCNKGKSENGSSVPSNMDLK